MFSSSTRPLGTRCRRLPVVLVVLVVGCGVGGCQPDPPDAHLHGPGGHDHAADDERPTIAVTAWSARHEVFAEFTTPVAGEVSQFATHVSDVSSGEPRRAGSIVYRLRPESGDAVQVSDRQPARDGIYLTAIRWPAPGIWDLQLEIGAIHTSPPVGADLADVVDLVDLGKVLVFASDAERDRAAKPAEAEGITFLKEQQWLLGTLTEVASRVTLTEHLRVPGRVRAAPSRTADVVPPLAGRLVADSDVHLPALGTRVDAGDVLAWVVPPVSEAILAAVAAEAGLARLEVDVEQAQAALDRTRLLHGQQARSTRELEEAEFALRATTASRDGTRRALAAYEAAGLAASALSADRNPADGSGLPRFAIRAPITGIVDHVEAVAGQSVSDTARILQIIDPEVVHVEAQVLAEDLARITLELPPHLGLTAFRGTPVSIPADSARLLHVGLHVDERTGRAPVVFELDNPDLRWRPGTAVEVALTTDHSVEALSIPLSALIEEEDATTVVFVQLGGETFERRLVTLGVRDGPRVEVLSGLAAGERVVSVGAYAVRLASVSTTAPSHGHAH